jgi:hypothetical protein
VKPPGAVDDRPPGADEAATAATGDGYDAAALTDTAGPDAMRATGVLPGGLAGAIERLRALGRRPRRHCEQCGSVVAVGLAACPLCARRMPPAQGPIAELQRRGVFEASIAIIVTLVIVVVFVVLLVAYLRHR